MEPSTIADCTGATMANAIRYAESLTQSMERFHIDTPRRQAAFLATIAVESANLSKVSEDLYYKDAARLASIYPRVFKSAQDAAQYTKNPKALGKLLYDGFWGRSLVQLTWRKNYQAASKALGFDYVSEPELLTEPLHASLVAGWFWESNGCNAPADNGDMRGVTRIVNGPALMHLDKREEQYAKNMQVLG